MKSLKFIVLSGAFLFAYVLQAGMLQILVENSNGKIDEIKSFLDKNQSEKVDVFSSGLNDALTAAVIKGYVDVIKYLVEKGAKIDRRGRAWLELGFRQPEVKKYLVGKGAVIVL